MSMTSEDFAHLRWPLALVATAIIAGVAMILVSRNVADQAESTQRQLTARQNDVRTRISRAREEEMELRDRIALFESLRARGIVGQEERLDWVEKIASIKSKRRLLDLQYELSPQHPVDDALLPEGPWAGGHEFMSSTMKLQMPLLHEGDLLGFLEDLRGTVHAHLLVRDCAIERDAPAQATAATPLRATCTIEWITLREKRS